MLGIGEGGKEVIRPDFNRSILIDFQGAQITSDAGFLLFREVDERFNILAPIGDALEDSRSPGHTRHTHVQMSRQRVYQVGSGYEDCNDADFLRIDPALRLALGKDHGFAASQSMLSRLENEVLGTEKGLKALEEAIQRSADALMKRRNRRRLIIDLDSTEDPAYGKQEHVAYNGHFKRNCFHPLFCFTSNGDCLAAKLRAGNAHSAEGTVEFITPVVDRYRDKFKLFWLRGDAAFAGPETYDYCESHAITYFIRLKRNPNLDKLAEPHMRRPIGRFPKSGIRIKTVSFTYEAASWKKPRRVVCKIEWHLDEVFPRVGFIVTNSRLPSRKVVQVYNGRGDVENRIKEGKNTLRWDKTSCHRFESNEARLKMGVIAYNILQIIREFYVWGEPVKRSMEWLILRLIKVGARVTHHARRWQVHIASAFPLRHHYQAILDWR